jgi:methylmalonyl-CoA mutase
MHEQGKNNIEQKEIFRSSKGEKQQQIDHLKAFHERNQLRSPAYLQQLKEAAISGENIFEILMEAVKYCSLGEIADTLYQVGGKYTRNL